MYHFIDFYNFKVKETFSISVLRLVLLFLEIKANTERDKDVFMHEK
jgi:hypothetical protein